MHTRIREELIAAARAAPSEEVCGFLYHDIYGVVHLHPCRNIAEDPTTDWEIDAQDHIAALQAGTLLGVYHSHPGDPVGFSEGDLHYAEEMALPQYLINTVPGTVQDYLPPTYHVPLEGRHWVLGFQDCWEIPRAHYRQAHRIYMQDYERDESYAHEKKDTVMANYEAEGFIRLPPDASAIRNDDILMFTTDRALPQHFGVFVGNSRFAHHAQGKLSQIEQLTDRWLSRLYCVFRHRNLA